MRLLLRLAWRNIWRQPRRTLLTVTAMAVGCAFCMAAIALGDGMFADGFKILVRQSLGHVQVHAPKYPKQRSLHESMDEAVVAELDRLADAAGVSGRAHGFALLGAGDKSAGGQLLGVDPAREPRVTLLHEKLVEGEYLGERPEKKILLGAGLARSLEAGVGDELVVVTQAADGSMGNALFRVGGVLKTGSVATDRSGALVHLRDLQELLVLEGRVHEVALLAKTRDGAPSLASGAERTLEGRGLLVRTWAQVNPELAKMLELQSVSSWIILFIVFSVASLGVLNTMLMSVLERTKELGVLRALGLRPRQVVALVLCESALLACVAAVVGTGLGLLADGYLVTYGLDLTRFIGDFSFGGIAFGPVLRGEVRLDRIVATVVGLFAVTLVASVWPALRAGRLRPVEAMRQE